MAEFIFSVLLSLSFSGGLMILLLFFLCALLRKRVSSKWQYYIWIVVIVRLLLPFAPERNLAGWLGERLCVFVQIPFTSPSGMGISDSPAEQRQVIQQQGLEEDSEKGESDFFLGKERTENMKSLGQREKLQDSIRRAALESGKYFCAIWLLAAMFLFLRKVTVYQSFMRFIRAGSTPVDDIGYLEALSGEEAALGVHKALELCVNPMVSSPMLIGFFHPCIVLPEGNLPEKEFRYTILHELIHYKRGDIYYKWVVQSVLCIHWFNPLLYLAARRINRLCELSCDEAVVNHLTTEKERREYAETLLNAMTSKGVLKERLASLTLGEDKKQLKERMETIMDGSRGKNTAGKKIMLAVLTAAVIVTSLFAGSYTAGAVYGVDAEDVQTGALKQAKAGKVSKGRNKSDKVTAAQADKMALALTKKIWVWEWVEFFVPYMTEGGVKKLIPALRKADWAGVVDMTTGKEIKFTKKQVNAARKKKPSHALTCGDIDSHALLIMQSNGDWDCISFMLPCMTKKGIQAVVSCYNSKHGGNEKRAKDYY